MLLSRFFSVFLLVSMNANAQSEKCLTPGAVCKISDFKFHDPNIPGHGIRLHGWGHIVKLVGFKGNVTQTPRNIFLRGTQEPPKCGTSAAVFKDCRNIGEAFYVRCQAPLVGPFAVITESVCSTRAMKPKCQLLLGWIPASESCKSGQIKAFDVRDKYAKPVPSQILDFRGSWSWK